MTDVEFMAAPCTSLSLDLECIEHSQRAATWKHAASSMFHGLTVHSVDDDLPMGSITGGEFGSGQLWTIHSPPLRVDYVPVVIPDCRASTFSVMLQLEGSTLVTQGARETQLHAHDICVLDGIAPFQLEVTQAASRIMFLRMPRELVIARHPHLAQQTAQRFVADEPGTAILRSVLLGLHDSAANLRPEQCMTALLGVTCLLGVPRPPVAPGRKIDPRVGLALAYIDTHFADRKLCANRIAQAQAMSRRRLDEILRRYVGASLSAQIWLRRLSQAATDLRDVNQQSRSVTHIAFSVGFVDAGHFTRSFRRQFGCTPREWRSRDGHLSARRTGS